MMNAMAVEMVIRTLNSILSDENKPIGRSVSNGFTERPGFVSVVRIPPNFSALVLDFWRFERVTDAMHGTNGLRTELMAQCLDVRIDGASAGSIHPIPHFLEQFLASEHGLRLAGQRGQQIEFRRGQVHLLAIAVTIRCAGSMTKEPKSRSFSFSEFLAMTLARSTRRSNALQRAMSSRMENGLVM